MAVKYNASAMIDGRYTSPDFDDVEDAIKFVEDAKSGTIVKFIGYPNLPGYLPEIDYKSVSMWNFEDGHWFSMSIFTGVSERMDEERPK